MNPSDNTHRRLPWLPCNRVPGRRNHRPMEKILGQHRERH